MKEVIEKWKLNHNLLAEKMEMSKGSFNNKLAERSPYKFSNEEHKKLKSILKDLMNDIKNSLK